jgi:hypothetical protein
MRTWRGYASPIPGSHFWNNTLSLMILSCAGPAKAGGGRFTVSSFASELF